MTIAEAQQKIVDIDNRITNGLKMPVVNLVNYRRLLSERSGCVVVIQKKGY